jgi:hypothetical protein
MRFLIATLSLGIVIGTTLDFAGCATKPPAPVPRVAAPLATETWAESLLTYDDPRANGDDTRAIQAATKALLGPAAADDAPKDLRFAVTIVGAGWKVDVWHLDPAATLGVGGFQSVQLDHDFNVQKAAGGA